jgi:ABC-type bacteriocin/lantibiotic exporter with double-glycine peptidase domain
VLAIVYGSATLVLFFAMVGLSRNLGLGVGDFLAFNAAFAQFQAAAMAAIGVVPAFLAFIPTYERMRPILDTVAETKTNQVDPGPLRGAIELRNVNFRYNGGPLVLEDVSLYVNPGEFVAVVGPSGSGKSTCLRMILGFEQPEAGSILIDGHEVGSLNLRLVRREIGVVLQHGRPLVGDIFHNIIGSLPLTVDDAWRAARLVGLEEEIRSMPMGMFTLVNQRGMSFSGGQRQRLLLARAIVSHPKILLLDEATSALDNHTQDLITRNLARMGITRIVIAHRLSSIRKADRIYVLEQGRVVEHGAFEDLVSRGGTFTRLTERQVVSL